MFPPSEISWKPERYSLQVRMLFGELPGDIELLNPLVDTTSYKLQATSYKLQATSYKLQGTSSKPSTIKLRLQHLLHLLRSVFVHCFAHLTHHFAHLRRRVGLSHSV